MKDKGIKNTRNDTNNVKNDKSMFGCMILKIIFYF